MTFQLNADKGSRLSRAPWSQKPTDTPFLAVCDYQSFLMPASEHAPKGSLAAPLEGPLLSAHAPATGGSAGAWGFPWSTRDLMIMLHFAGYRVLGV